MSIITTLHVKKQNGKKESDFKHGFVLMDEQGNITERKPGEFVFHVEYNQKGKPYCLNEKTTLRLVSIPSEKRFPENQESAFGSVQYDGPVRK